MTLANTSRVPAVCGSAGLFLAAAMLVFGILLFVLGLGIRYWLGRRAFNRRNAAGVEEFTSYEAVTGSRLLEGFGRKIGGILVVVGLLLATFGYFGRHH